MSLFAVIKDGVVENIIVAEQGFIDQLPDNIKNPAHDTGSLTELHSFVDVTKHTPAVGVGWLVDSSGVFSPAPQETLVANPTSIAGDGKTVSTVTFTALPGATGDVVFSVNGHTQTVALANGIASVQVASVTPGDTINVTCGSVSTTIEVT